MNAKTTTQQLQTQQQDIRLLETSEKVYQLHIRQQEQQSAFAKTTTQFKESR